MDMLLYVMKETYLSRVHPSRLTTYMKRARRQKNWILSQQTWSYSYLKNTFGLLQKDECFLVILSGNEVGRSICQLRQDDWDLILVDLNLLIVHLVKRVAFLWTYLVSSFASRGRTIFDSSLVWTFDVGLLDRQEVWPHRRWLCQVTCCSFFDLCGDWPAMQKVIYWAACEASTRSCVVLRR